MAISNAISSYGEYRPCSMAIDVVAEQLATAADRIVPLVLAVDMVDRTIALDRGGDRVADGHQDVPYYRYDYHCPDAEQHRPLVGYFDGLYGVQPPQDEQVVHSAYQDRLR